MTHLIQAIALYIVGVELQLSGLPDKSVHVAERIWVSWNFMRWSWINLRSTTVDLSACPSRIWSI